MFSNSVESLRVYLTKADETDQKIVWVLYGLQNTDQSTWLEGSIPIRDSLTEDYRIIFEAIVSSTSEDGYIA